MYSEETGNLYVHHDIALPALPLCLAWMDMPPRTAAMARASGSADEGHTVGYVEEDLSLFLVLHANQDKRSWGLNWWWRRVLRVESGPRNLCFVRYFLVSKDIFDLEMAL